MSRFCFQKLDHKDIFASNLKSVFYLGICHKKMKLCYFVFLSKNVLISNNNFCVADNLFVHSITFCSAIYFFVRTASTSSAVFMLVNARSKLSMIGKKSHIILSPAFFIKSAFSLIVRLR